ncbi:YdcF family protein [Agarivorans sp. MS3-6]
MLSAFALKKILITLIMPSTALVILLLLGLLFMLVGRRFLGRSLIGFSLVTTLLLSLYPISGAMLHYWERQYSGLTRLPADSDLIVVLGCLHYQDDNQPLSSQILPCGVVKVVEAVRLWRQNPSVSILLSGGDIEGSGVQHADMLAALAESLGVPKSQLIRSYHNQDTATEVTRLANTYTDQSMVLVTQASHMPRAMSWFARYDLQVVAAPTYYQVRNWQKPFTWRSFVPRLSHIAKADTAVYETLANLWLRLKS